MCVAVPLPTERPGQRKSEALASLAENCTLLALQSAEREGGNMKGEKEEFGFLRAKGLVSELWRGIIISPA